MLNVTQDNLQHYTAIRRRLTTQGYTVADGLLVASAGSESRSWPTNCVKNVTDPGYCFPYKVKHIHNFPILAAAFDAIDHNILITRLSFWLLIHDHVLSWFKRYLSSRSLRVTCDNQFCSNINAEFLREAYCSL